MNWEAFSPADYVTSVWSGGTTTQLAISPVNAVYASRNFLWRLSSAKVELEHSDFTPLPDYNRLISVLDGELSIRIGEGEKSPLPRFSLRAFDGGTPVESWGKCSDFNLMLRKGLCIGLVQHVMLAPKSSSIWCAPVTAPCRFARTDIAIYCVAGDVKLDVGPEAASGWLLLCREAEFSYLDLSSDSGTELMISVIRY